MSLLESLFINDQMLSICSNHSSKDWGSLALNMGISLMKCKFSWREEDLVILFRVSVACGVDGVCYLLILFDVQTV